MQNNQQPVNKETARLMMEMALDTLRYQAPALKEYQALSAELAFNYYNQLLRAGFTEAQALTIVTAHGAIPKAPGGSE